jgi:hypothetical protein
MDEDKVVESLRKIGVSMNSLDIRRPSRVGEYDAHGNMWYCFCCDTFVKDHRSFKSSRAMLDHLKSKHSLELIRTQQYRKDEKVEYVMKQYLRSHIQ